MPISSQEEICNMALVRAGVNYRLPSIDNNTATAQACKTEYVQTLDQMLSKYRPLFAIKREQLFPLTGVPYLAAQTFGVGDLAQYGEDIYRSLKDLNKGYTPSDNASAAWWRQVTRDGYQYVCPVPADMIEPIAAWEKPSVSANGTPQPFIFGSVAPGVQNLRNPRASERAPFTLENADDGTDALVLLTDIDTPILRYVKRVSNPQAYPPMFINMFAWRLAVALNLALKGDAKAGELAAKMAERAEVEAFILDKRQERLDQEPVSEFEAVR